MITNKNIDTVRSGILVGVIGKDEFISLLKNDEITDRENIALISIHDPSNNFHDSELLYDFIDVLQIRFWDTEESMDGSNYSPLSSEQGLAIKNFILRNKSRKFLIHCEAGMSRSAGVGLAVECIVKYDGDKYKFSTGFSDIKAHNTDRYFPNYTVFDRIIST